MSCLGKCFDRLSSKDFLLTHDRFITYSYEDDPSKEGKKVSESKSKNNKKKETKKAK